MSPTDAELHNRARRQAVAIVRTLRDHGHAAYLAGGCVRDELLGLTPTDYDVATDAEPAEIATLFERTSAVGAAFGVVLVHHGRGLTTEVATFRKDFSYADKRRPDRVEFSTAEEDARRRDFTVNALFLDPLESDPENGVIDFVGGRADLIARVIRAVGDPSERLDEDHLRALRAVRFACRLGFVLDPGTSEAIRRHAAELAGVSRERIGEELRRMLVHPARARAASMLQDLTLDAPALGEPHATPELPVLAGLGGEVDVALALSAWAVDRHGARALEAAARWRRSLCLSNEERDSARAILAALPELRGPWFGGTIAQRKRAAARAGFEGARSLLAIIDPGQAARVDAELSELGAIGMGLRPEPLLTGDDLIGMGLEPGPAFSRILDGVYDAQLDGRVSDRGGAERLARELSGSGGV